MFGWNESGQLAQPTGNLVKPAECFSAVEKLFMACCTMQPEDDAALPRSGDADDEEVQLRQALFCCTFELLTHALTNVM